MRKELDDVFRVKLPRVFTSQEEEILQGAVIGEVEAGFVSVEEVGGGFGGKVGKSRGHAVQLIAGSLSGHLVVEGAGLDGPGAPNAG